MTPKQESFVREYLLDSNATQAAIRAGYSARTANEQGSRLLANASVSAAIAERRRILAARADFTVDAHMDKLAEIRDAAVRDGKFSAAATAEMARGKVAGFYVERVEMNAKVMGTTQYVAEIPRRGKQ